MFKLKSLISKCFLLSLFKRDFSSTMMNKTIDLRQKFIRFLIIIPFIHSDESMMLILNKRIVLLLPEIAQVLFIRSSKNKKVNGFFLSCVLNWFQKFVSKRKILNLDKCNLKEPKARIYGLRQRTHNQEVLGLNPC